MWQIVALDLLLIWMLKCVALILGYLCVRLGHQLLFAGVKGEFQFSAKGFGASTTLKAVSPGLLFVLLGVLLMIYAVAVNKVVDVSMPANTTAPEVPLPAPEGK